MHTTILIKSLLINNFTWEKHYYYFKKVKAMSHHYWSGMNVTPGVHGGGGSIYRGGNNITTRGNEIMEAMGS